MAEKVVYVKAPRKERAEKIDLDVFFDSMLAAGAIAVIYFVGWPLVQKLIKGEIKLPDLKFPVIGSRLPTSDNDNPIGSGGASNPITGSVSSTTQWYKANGPTAAMPNARCSSGKCGTSSGGNSGGNRWENEMKGWMNKGFEVVVYFQIPQGAMCGGGHIGLKHGGPNHTPPCDYQTLGACCCWFDTGIRDNGTVYTEIERPHPHNTGTKMYGNIGSRLDSGKPIGVRWHISREGAGIRLIQWVDNSGTAGANQWKETYNILDTGQIMPKDYFSHITNLQNIEIRISDVVCKDVKMLLGPVSRQII